MLPVASSAGLLCLCGLVSGLLSFSFNSRLPICAWGIPKSASSQFWPCFQPHHTRCLACIGYILGSGALSQCSPHLSGQLVPHKCQQEPPSSLMQRWMQKGASSTETCCLLPKAKPGSSPTTWFLTFDDECSPECLSLVWSLWSRASLLHRGLCLWHTCLILLPAGGSADMHCRCSV